MVITRPPSSPRCRFSFRFLPGLHVRLSTRAFVLARRFRSGLFTWVAEELELAVGLVQYSSSDSSAEKVTDELEIDVVLTDGCR